MEHHDTRGRYCRLLGHDVTFAYCRRPGGERFCRNIVGCWADSFDIQCYLRENYTGEQISASMAPPKEKMVTLVELIQQARDRA